MLRDPIDKEHLEQVIETRGYQIIREAMERIFASKLKDLRRDQPEVSTARLRGYLEALETVGNLPGSLLADYRKRTGN